MKGGKRPGAGRKPGGRNRRTLEAIAAAEASGITPLEYMLRVMRNKRSGAAVRLDAAKSAAPYVHARLASIEHKGNGDHPIEHTVKADAKQVAELLAAVQSKY
jgi:hypothetical protein